MLRRTWTDINNVTNGFTAWRRWSSSSDENTHVSFFACVSIYADRRLITSQYFCIASSLETPLHFSHASHLAFPFMSNIPGRAVRILERDGQDRSATTIGRVGSEENRSDRTIVGAWRTGVDVAEVGLLEPAVHLEHVLV